MSASLEVPPGRVSFRVKEICELFGFGPAKIRAAIRSGELRAVKIDSTVLVPRESLETWLSQAYQLGPKGQE